MYGVSTPFNIFGNKMLVLELSMFLGAKTSLELLEVPAFPTFFPSIVDLLIAVIVIIALYYFNSYKMVIGLIASFH